MGQSQTRQGGEISARRGRLNNNSSPGGQNQEQSSHPARGSRPDLTSGPGDPSTQTNQQAEGEDAPFQHRETRAEREARKLAKEREVRARERERSLKEEHVDGGYLVTLGTYTGPEDFSKSVVRQLQIERKLAPFWRGIDGSPAGWTDHQIIAAARGLPIPSPDEQLNPSLVPTPATLLAADDRSPNSLAVPVDSRTAPVSLDRDTSRLGSGSKSPAAGGGSPFKTNRAKALAAALSVGSSSRNASQIEPPSREINLPHEPFLQGELLELVLYKNAKECPICMLSYPPFLNNTRCCDQPICSECFVQIKRTDPHARDHHSDGEARNPNEGLLPGEPPEMLISEPSVCPYCQRPELGVTYEPPKFQRGLIYSNNTSVSTTPQTSSQTSLQPPASPGASDTHGRRRGQSLSVNAPNVISTDRIRPDWKKKLEAAQTHQLRRAAAATALHQAAFLADRVRGGGSSRRSAASSNRNPDANERINEAVASLLGVGVTGTRSRSRNRVPEDFEEVMLREAMRLSLVEEEKRRRKEEQQARQQEKEANKRAKKEAKQREKEQKKLAKSQSHGPYSGSAGVGASHSSISLKDTFNSLVGRRRDNSGAGSLRQEATVQRIAQASGSETQMQPNTEGNTGTGKGKGIDRSAQGSGTVDKNPCPVCPAIPSGSGSRLSSHQQGEVSSNVTPMTRSIPPSPIGSYIDDGVRGRQGDDRQSGRVSDGDDDGESDQDNGEDVDEMFNFNSIAAQVGIDLDNGTVGQQGESGQDGEEEKESGVAHHVENSPTTHGRETAEPDSIPISPVTPTTESEKTVSSMSSKQLDEST